MTNQIHWKVGQGDIELLSVLDRGPLTPTQLCRLSQTFANPCTNEGNLRRRLQSLAIAGLVHAFPHTVSRDGRSPNLWKLTPQGYRVLGGQAAQLQHHAHSYQAKPARVMLIS